MSLAVLDDVDVVYLQWRAESVEDEQWLAGVAESCAPAYCTAEGQVLLAGLSESERRGILERMTFDDPTIPTEWTVESSWSELETTAREGLGINDEESAVGVQAIAVAVTDREGAVIAALGLTGCKSRVTIKRLLVDHLEVLRETAQELSWLGLCRS